MKNLFLLILLFIFSCQPVEKINPIVFDNSQLEKIAFSAEKIEDHDKLKNFYNENTHNHSIGKPFDKHVTKECIDNIIIYYMI